jgi:hypothetical protein
MTTNSEALPGWFKGNGQRHDDEEASLPSAHESQQEEQAPTSATGATTGATTGGGSDSGPVIVWEAANRLEAEIVAGRLQSEGIPAFIRGEALGPIYGLTTGGLAASVVLVPAPLAEKALDILYTDSEWVEWDESDDVDPGA